MKGESVELSSIRNAKVVTPTGIFEGGVAIEDGKIVAVGTDRVLPGGGASLDARGVYLLPGVVDPEAHLGSNSALDEDFRTESRAAVAAGVTTWGLQLTTHTIFRAADGRPAPDLDLRFSDLLPDFREIGEANSSCDFFLTPLLMSVGQAEEIPGLAESGGVTTYKLYMHMRLGREELQEAWPQAPLLGVRSFDDSLVYVSMQNVSKLGEAGLLSLHCENWEIARVRERELRAEGRTDTAAWHDRSPGYLEAMHVRAYAYLANTLGCRFHVQHVTAIETLETLAALKTEGIRVYGQTAAHYLTLDAGVWKVNTPLRPADQHPYLWEALRTGLVNAVGSDHVCRRMSRAEMDRGSVWASVSGFPSRVEAHLPALISFGVAEGRLDLQRLAEVTARNPARLWGLADRKGEIRPGFDADFVLVDLSKRVTLGPAQILSAAGWSIYEGMEFRGWPVATVLRGRLVAEWSGDACTLAEGQLGEYLARDPSSRVAGADQIV